MTNTAPGESTAAKPPAASAFASAFSSVGSDALRMGMVAGETSGDLLASLLLQGLKKHWPALAAGGIGGP